MASQRGILMIMETGELQTRQEKTVQKINPSQVMDAFELFERHAQEGFTTTSSRMADYGRFLHTLHSYFSQENQGVLVSTPGIEMVDKLFYHHENNAPVPIAFIIDTRERLKKEVLEEGVHQPLYGKVNKELDFMRAATQAELQQVTLGYNLERQAEKQLMKYSERHSPDRETEDVKAQLTEYNEKTSKIKDTAITMLARDNEELASDIHRRNDFVSLLNRFAENPEVDPDELRTALRSYQDYFGTKNGISVIDELYVRASIGQNDAVKKGIGDLLTKAQDPDFLWKSWVNKGVIPASLLDSFDEILVLNDLRETSLIIADETKEIKAKYLTPFLEKGISAVMLMEIAEGKYEFTDTFMQEQIDAFLHFYDSYRKDTKHPWSLKRKIITAALIGTLIASPFILNSLNNQEDISSQQEIAELMNEIPPDQLEELSNLVIPENDNQEQPSVAVNSPQNTTPSTDSTQTGKASGEIKGQPNGNQGSGKEGNANDSYPTSNDEIKPRNDSPEGMKNASKIVLWNLSGSDLNGYYREKTSSRFDVRRKNWIVTREYASGAPVQRTTRKDITISNTISISGRILDLPDRDNYKITDGSIKLSGQPVNYSVVQTVDGNSYLYFPRSEDLGKQITISYSIGRENKITTPAPSQKELKEMKTKLISENNIPDDIQKFLSELRSKKDTSSGVKAKLIEKFVKSNFLYSLNQKWSDYYDAAGDANGFLKRVLQTRKTDCDVANTALVALLRNENIPARMAFGVNNSSGDSTKLTGNEAHGWVEAYIGNEWVLLDATPDKMDDYTKNALQNGEAGAGGGSDIQGLEDFAVSLDSLTAWLDENWLAKGFLYADLANLLAWGSSVALRRRNNKYADKLMAELERRTHEYTDDTDIADYLKALEMRALKYSQEHGRSYAAAVFPPAGYIALGKDIEILLKLRKFPFKEVGKHVEKSEHPSSLQYATEILGYPEHKVKRAQINRGYAESRKKMIDTFHAVTRSLSDPYDEINRVNGIYFQEKISHFEGTLEAKILNMEQPKTDTEWEQMKKEFLEKSYKSFAKAHKGALRHLSQVCQKRKINMPEVPHLLSKEEFSAYLDEVFKVRLVFWEMERQRAIALQSVSRNEKKGPQPHNDFDVDD